MSSARNAGDRLQRTALVVIGDSGDRDQTTQYLSAAGFAVTRFGNSQAALAEAQQHSFDLAVVDIAVAEGTWTYVLRKLQQVGGTRRIPVILTVSSVDQLSIDDGLVLSISDYVLKPVKAEELVHRADVVITHNERQLRRRAKATQLREQTRQVSAAIRSTHKPEEMAAHLVDGLGEAFGAERVLLTTFEDERVPKITRQWAREGLELIPPSFSEHEEQARPLANQLWENSTVLELGPRSGRTPAEGLEDLANWAAGLGPGASVVAPIGENDMAFGLICLVAADEDRTWTQAELSLTQHVLGNLAHGLIQGQLITGQQEVVERLKELDRAKNDFVATVNHELRTPLTSITGYLEMVQEGAGGAVPDSAGRMLEIVERNTVRLRSLVEDMLTLSRMDSGSIQTIAPVDVGDLLEMVMTAMSPLAVTQDVQLNYERPQTALLVLGDVHQLEQAFTNIVSNAVKFTPATGKVEVTAERAAPVDEMPASVVVRVQDTGMGIPADEIPRLFTRFYRASNATAAAVPGTGLGLSIVKGVVEQHSGELNVQSVEGEGTTVTVRLPETGLAEES
ncbi:ATP-binding response regulator [Arthrobacter sp. H14]|uniref:ATP-binding response regulator n=1 Tax=Arthrobacter sp. H14 TaxID=1312959 RepID=UPI00055E72EC|nr:ATP-binding protein [Arthrobacter sp. H14]